MGSEEKVARPRILRNNLGSNRSEQCSCMARTRQQPTAFAASVLLSCDPIAKRSCSYDGSQKQSAAEMPPQNPLHDAAG